MLFIPMLVQPEEFTKKKKKKSPEAISLSVSCMVPDVTFFFLTPASLHNLGQSGQDQATNHGVHSFEAPHKPGTVKDAALISYPRVFFGI